MRNACWSTATRRARWRSRQRCARPSKRAAARSFRPPSSPTERRPMAFRSVLIANRGEIALRVIRACRRRGLRAIAVCSEADRGGAWLQAADDYVCIGPAPAQASYLDASALLLAAEVTGAEAIHPGYGFLAENGAFAEAVERAGLVLIGPTAEVIRLMGDKIRAKEAMRAAGVPCVPGSEGALPTDADVCAAVAGQIGYPAIIKAAGGGGGRGVGGGGGAGGGRAAPGPARQGSGGGRAH